MYIRSKFKNKLSLFAAFFCMVSVLIFAKGKNLNNSLKSESLSSSIESSLSLSSGEQVLKESLDLPTVDLHASELELSASNAAIYSIDSDTFVFNKNAEEKRPIASITKVMTGLLVSKYGRYEDTGVISQYAVDTFSVPQNYKLGEELTIKNLLKSALISSNNDASVTLSEYLGGRMLGFETPSESLEHSKVREQQFVELMNSEAKKIGLDNTNFSNSHGLHTDNGYSTVKDVAYLFKEATKDKELEQIMGIKVLSYESVDGLIQHLEQNTNELLGVESGIVAGKTGTTAEAKENLVVLWESPIRNKYIIVVLGSDDRYTDTRKIIDKLRAKELGD